MGFFKKRCRLCQGQRGIQDPRQEVGYTDLVPSLHRCFWSLEAEPQQLIIHGKPGLACRTLSCSKLRFSPQEERFIRELVAEQLGQQIRGKPHCGISPN